MNRDSLLHLFMLWRDGATIVAGTGVPVVDPVPTGPRVVCACVQCPTWCLGASQAEALGRLAAHQRRCHQTALTIAHGSAGHG